MQQILGYRLTVTRGARAGLVRDYKPAQRVAARRFADRLDLEYGAICASVRPLFGDSPASHTAAYDDACRESFRCTPGSIATEHAAEMLELFAAAGAGVQP